MCINKTLLQTYWRQNKDPHTFPIFTILRTEEVVAHLASSDPLDDVARLERVDHQAIKFLLTTVHLHVTLFGEQLPTTLAYAQAGIVHLLRGYSLDLQQ